MATAAIIAMNVGPRMVIWLVRSTLVIHGLAAYFMGELTDLVARLKRR
jgi:hypothetical protein